MSWLRTKDFFFFTDYAMLSGGLSPVNILPNSLPTILMLSADNLKCKQFGLRSGASNCQV